MGTSQRSQSMNRLVPGPGQYTLGSKLGGPKYTMSSKSGCLDLNKYIVSPGPSQYTPRQNFTQLSYSMSARPNTAKSLASPGPGNYNIRSEKSLQVPSYK